MTEEMDKDFGSAMDLVSLGKLLNLYDSLILFF